MNSLKIYTALLFTMLLWASAFVGIRIGLIDYSPGALALLRFIAASFCMAVIYAFLPARKPIPWNTRWELLTIGAATIGVYHIALNYGEVTVSAGIASFLIGLSPVITLVFSALFLNERLNIKVWAGVGFSLSGLLMMVFAERSQAALGGILAVLIAAISSTVYNMTQKRYLKDFHPVAVTAWVIWGATFILLFFSKELIQEIPLAMSKTTLSVLYLGIFPAALAYVSWCYVLNSWSASKASIFMYALPILSTVMGFFILAEKPSIFSLIGGCLALAGALMANRFQELSPPLLQLDAAKPKIQS